MSYDTCFLGDINPTIYAQDYAGIFGNDNANNKAEKSTTISIQDTTKPTLLVTAPVSARSGSVDYECGYSATQPVATYNDIRDDLCSSRHAGDAQFAKSNISSTIWLLNTENNQHVMSSEIEVSSMMLVVDQGYKPSQKVVYTVQDRY